MLETDAARNHETQEIADFFGDTVRLLNDFGRGLLWGCEVQFVDPAEQLFQDADEVALSPLLLDFLEAAPQAFAAHDIIIVAKVLDQLGFETVSLDGLDLALD